MTTREGKKGGGEESFTWERVEGVRIMRVTSRVREEGEERRGVSRVMIDEHQVLFVTNPWEKYKPF